jgi:hypothetical protein
VEAKFAAQIEAMPCCDNTALKTSVSTAADVTYQVVIKIVRAK